MITKTIYTIGVFLNLSKAFDTINHHVLLNKLSFYGIRGLQLTWFLNYLSNTQQYVNFNGTFSQKNTIKCGVPQGSTLGPILFLLYINDIINSSTFSRFILFADDTNIIYSDKTLTTLLQKVNLEINNVSLWFKTNKLVLNPKKTKFMLFVPKNKPIIGDVNLYSDGLETDLEVKVQKFLGVILNSKLDWKNHVCTKIAKTIGVINKIKYCIGAKAKRSTLYCSLVLSYINYCDVVWACTYHSKASFPLQPYRSET